MKFLLNTITDWFEPPRARHQIAYELAKDHPVVFISGNKIGLPGFKSSNINGNLEVIIPFFPIHLKIRTRIPIINKIYQKWLFRILCRKYQNHIVLNFDFTAKYLHEYFSRTVYYCNDDHVGLSYKMNPKFIADYQNNTEKTIACKSVFCIATSEYLKNKLLQYNKNVFEIRLGAPEVDNIKINTTIPKREKIHVGFVGFLQTADIQLLNNIMDHEEFLITIIGPVEKKETGRLAHYNNIQYTGKLTGQTLYDEINKLDVGIIPYSLSSKIDRTPNKLWLYLAVGKPSVITNISGIKNWRFPEKFVYKANSEDEFSKLIKKAHAENNPSLIEKRIQFARNNTWGNRMDQLIKILGTFQLDKI